MGVPEKMLQTDLIQASLVEHEYEGPEDYIQKKKEEDNPTKAKDRRKKQENDQSLENKPIEYSNYGDFHKPKQVKEIAPSKESPLKEMPPSNSKAI
jgi:hypothetical protein